MAKKTLQERYAAGLSAIGYTEDLQARSKKFRTFIRPSKLYPGTDEKVYLGKAGSVRYGKTVSNSMAMNDGNRRALLAKGDAA